MEKLKLFCPLFDLLEFKSIHAMRIFFCLFFTIIFSECGQNDKKSVAHFDFIEITYDNGWTGGSTVHIDSLGIIYKCKYHIISKIENVVCCVDTLDSEIMDTLNVKIDDIKDGAIDSIYDGRCEDCGGFIVKIKFDNKILRSRIIGANEFNNTISNLSKYITAIKINNNQIDTCLIFETTRYIIPPPINPQIKFSPPTIE